MGMSAAAWSACAVGPRRCARATALSFHVMVAKLRITYHGMCMQFAMCICTHSTRNLQMRVRRARAWNHIVPCMDRSEAAWSALALRSCMHVYLHIDRSRSDACARVAYLFSALRTARTNRTSRVMHECAQAVGCRCRA